MSENGKETRPSASWRLEPDGQPLRFWRVVLLFSLIAIAFQIGVHLVHQHLGDAPGVTAARKTCVDDHDLAVGRDE